jgi:hypothetical protein
MIIQRGKPQPDRTNGIATLPDGTEIKTLERPWLNNQPNVSCIPAGIYKFKRDNCGRFQWFKVLDVPGRTHIEFHEGHKPTHSEGCILICFDGLKAMESFFNDYELEYVLEIKNYESI